MKKEKREEIDPIIGEQTDWNVLGSQHVGRKFVIPIDGLSREEAEKQLQELMCDYKEEIMLNVRIVEKRVQAMQCTDGISIIVEKNNADNISNF